MLLIHLYGYTRKLPAN